jgi:hypothetical protein
MSEPQIDPRVRVRSPVRIRPEAASSPNPNQGSKPFRNSNFAHDCPLDPKI